MTQAEHTPGIYQSQLMEESYDRLTRENATMREALQRIEQRAEREYTVIRGGQEALPLTKQAWAVVAELARKMQ